jgi:hypothetical protein
MVRKKKARAKRRKAPARRPKRVKPAARSRPWRIEGRRLVILFRKSLEVPHTDGWRDKPGRWRELQANYGPMHLHRMFVASAERLRALEQMAARDNPKYPWPNFLHYFFLYVPRRGAAKILREIGDWREIESAYLDESTTTASPGDLCGSPSQHIAPAPTGVGAGVAWGFAGGRGEGQKLVDVEKGWAWQTHVRLPVANIQLLAGKSQVGGHSHGTRVLGIICGGHNLPGCKGIAPKLQRALLVSCIPDPSAVAGHPVIPADNNSTEQPENVYEAVSLAIGQLATDVVNASSNHGVGVLLIELQTATGLPLESLPGIFNLLVLAANRGVTVVAAAGNGQQKLDRQADSGAILVGAARAALVQQSGVEMHNRFPSSNFGDRIDCYAWGESVVAPSWFAGGVDPPHGSGVFKRCQHFGETSAAAAIIAGVALVIQGIVASAGGPRLSPTKLRAVLADPALGTPSTASAKIKSMPDLAKILRLNRRGLCPALGITPVPSS